MARGKKPRILVITPTYPQTVNSNCVPGFIRNLSATLADNDYFIDVIAPYLEGAKSHERFANISIYRFRYALPGMHPKEEQTHTDTSAKTNNIHKLWRPVFLFFLQRKIQKLLKRHSYQAIHAHWLAPQGFCAAKVRAAIKSDIPLICSAHGHDLDNTAKGSDDSAKLQAIKNATLITASSRAAKESLSQKYRSYAQKIEVLHLGADLNNLYCRMPYVKRQKYALLFVGRLVPESGFSVLIQAMPHLQAQVPEIKLYAVGVGPEKHALEELAKEYGCSRSIQFMGNLAPPAIALFYNKARMLIVPNLPMDETNGLSDEEAMRQVCIEAMGCKCPVVSAKLKPIEEVVMDNDTGRLFRAGSPEDLADKVLWMLNHPQEAKELVNKAHKHVHAQFNMEKISEEYMGIMQKIIGQG